MDSQQLPLTTTLVSGNAEHERVGRSSNYVCLLAFNIGEEALLLEDDFMPALHLGRRLRILLVVQGVSEAEGSGGRDTIMEAAPRGGRPTAHASGRRVGGRRHLRERKLGA